MLETILAISGKPGLFRLVSRGSRAIIVETLDAEKNRTPAFETNKILSLADIAMYTDAEEVPLRQVLKNILEKEDGKRITLDPKKASKNELNDYLAQVLPNFDRDRVYPADIKKLIQWYNILIDNNLTDFDEVLQETQGDNIDDRKE